MIKIGVYDSYGIVRAGVMLLLREVGDFECVELDVSGDVVEQVREGSVNVVVAGLHRETMEETLLMVHGVTQSFERVRVIVLSSARDEQLMVSAIRSGAKGFVALESEREELVQAVYTVRNGFEYYSQSISHLLVGKYISTMMKTEGDELSLLSPRQIEIIRLWGANKSNKEIADELFLSVRTVESHKNHIMQRLNLKSTVDMIKFGIRNNLISL